jgi:hypothetical protein
MGTVPQMGGGPDTLREEEEEEEEDGTGRGLTWRSNGQFRGRPDRPLLMQQGTRQAASEAALVACLAFPMWLGSGGDWARSWR